jgi:hypothetical protein
MSESYMINEAGVCGAFATSSAQAELETQRIVTAEKQAQSIDWNRIPTPDDDPWIRVAEVVDDINNKEHVPTQVLKDTIELIRRRHHGDEPTTEQATSLELIEQTLDDRGEEGGYAEAASARYAKVVQRGDEWCVTTKDGSKTLGCHDSEEKANAQLQAIEISKAKG